VNHEGNWYGFVHNWNGGSIIRLDFGSSLSNAPVATSIVTGLGGINSGMTSTLNNGNTFLIVTNTNNFKIVRLVGSPEYIPISSDVLTTSNIGGASLLKDISLMNECGIWYGFATSRTSQKKLFRLEFGSNIFSNPTVIELANNIWNNEEPTAIQVVKEGDKYILFNTTLSGNLFRVDLGTNIKSATYIFKDFSSMGDYGIGYDLVFAKDLGRWHGFIQNDGSRDLFKISFPENCAANSGWSAENSPTNINFNFPGTYKIGLTAYKNSYLVDSAKIVVVKNATAPTITYSTNNLCIENSNVFTGISSNDPSVTTWNWDFGDTQTGNGQNAIHQFDTAGIYDVALSIESDNGCTNQITQPLRIYEKPVSNFSIDNSTLCSNSELFFTNDSQLFGADTLVSYAWNFNNEVYSSAEDTSVIFTSGGSKSVTLSASIPGCTTDSTKIIEVVEGPSVAYSHEGICETDEFIFNNLTTGENISGYLWDFGDGYTSTLQNPTHFYNLGGTFNVSLSAFNMEGCNNFWNQDITVGRLPVPDFTYELPCSDQEVQFYDQSSVVEANISSYRWTVQNPDLLRIATEKDPLLFLEEDGSTDVTLSVVSTLGCEDSITRSVDVLTSPTVLINENINCVTDSSVFTSVSSLPGGNIISNTWFIQNKIFTSPTVKYPFNQPGDYDITLTSRADNLCENTLIKSIKIAALPLVDFSMDGSCENEFIQFTNLSTSPDDLIRDYLWSIDGSTVSFNENFSYALKSSGLHTVKLKVTTDRNCISEDSQSLNINPSPTSVFTADPVYGAPPMEVAFENESLDANRFLWDFSENNDDQSAETDASYVYESIGTEWPRLIAYNEFNCTDTSELSISVVNPVLAAAIESVTPSVVDDKINFVVRIINNGTVVLTDPQLKINFSNQINIFETIPHILLPGDRFAYQLSFQISSMPSNNLSNICFELLTDGYGYVEENYLDNMDCISFSDELQIIPPYPNPVEDLVKIPMILPERSDVFIQLLTATGNVTREIKYTSLPEGLNLVELDLSTYASGTYYLQVSTSNGSSTQKIVVR
jgi:PKD repeat protein